MDPALDDEEDTDGIEFGCSESAFKGRRDESDRIIPDDRCGDNRGCDKSIYCVFPQGRVSSSLSKSSRSFNSLLSGSSAAGCGDAKALVDLLRMRQFPVDPKLAKLDRGPKIRFEIAQHSSIVFEKLAKETHIVSGVTLRRLLCRFDILRWRRSDLLVISCKFDTK